MAIVTGTNKPQITSKRFNFDYRTGWSKEVTIEGLKEQVKHEAQKYAAFAQTIDLVENGPTSTMTARIDTDQMSPVNSVNELSTTWEIVGQSAQRHISENPRISGGVSARDIAVIKKQVDAIVAGKITVANALAEATVDGVSYAFEGSTGYGSGTLSAGEKKLRILFYKYMVDQESTITSEYVLRKNQVVTNNYELKMATAGVENVWTLGALIRGENCPAAIAATLSDAARSTVANDTSSDILHGTSATWNFGFLKQAPQITYTVGGQIERSQEWWLNYWLSTDYPLYA